MRLDVHPPLVFLERASHLVLRVRSALSERSPSGAYAAQQAIVHGFVVLRRASLIPSFRFLYLPLTAASRVARLMKRFRKRRAHARFFF